MESQNYLKLIVAARKVVETGSKDIYYENPHGDADSESSQVEEHQQALLSLEKALEEADDVITKTVNDELAQLEEKHDLLWKEANVFDRWIEDIKEAAASLGLNVLIDREEEDREFASTVSFELKDLDEGIIYLHIDFLDNGNEEVWWEITLVDAAGNERSFKKIAREELENLSTLEQAKLAVAAAAEIFKEQKGSKEMEDTSILLPELSEEELLSGLLVNGEENNKDELAKHKEFFVTHQSNPLTRTIPVPLESLGSPCMIKVEGYVKLTDGQYLSISAEDVEEIRLKDGGVLTAGKKMTVSFRAVMQVAQEITVTAPTKDAAINIAGDHLSKENWKPSPLVDFDKVHEDACSSADFRSVEEK